MKIGLALSGGGYRAASFSLGVLSYLERVKNNDVSLLSQVIALSTVSGGTITGARYVIGKKRDEPFEDIYKSIYCFMRDKDIVSLGLGRLTSEKGWKQRRIRSLINSFADIYDEMLFDHEKFGRIMVDDNFHLKHISFNATEFSTAKQFRFQWSSRVNTAKLGEPDRGIIGNKDYRILETIAKEIRMGDILAASSCFPGGFEPVNFPDDFILPKEVQPEEISEISLMDGGIVDNQGINPLLLADERMLRNRSDCENAKKEGKHELDLIIVSDVTSPYMKSYIASEQKPLNCWRRLSLFKVFIFNFIIFAGSITGIYFSIRDAMILLAIASSMILTLSILIFIAISFLLILPSHFAILEPFRNPISKLFYLQFQIYENMIFNRIKSILKMTGDVFLKHIRRLNFEKIYQDKSWDNRRIMNAIYELRPGEKKLQDKINGKKISETLIPSPKTQEVAEIAASMGTTLWFTEEELKKYDMINTIIACGQFNTCWNLLEYIEKITRDPSNINANHQFIVDCKQQMLEDWEKFQKDPYWLVKEINEKTFNN